VADESPQDRVNRELIELLNELRVALPGVQVLFAFLLAVPFSSGFAKLSAGDRRVHLAAFLLTAVATAFLIAPSSYHRLRWRAKDKERMLVVSNHLTIVGLLLLAAAITCTVFFITDFVFHLTWAAAFTAAVALVFVVLWYGLPLFARLTAARRAR
jgi:predicted membrane channel-forming protein YqfA (hemolysin III family)